jgi:hypothetical protein
MRTRKSKSVVVTWIVALGMTTMLATKAEASPITISYNFTYQGSSVAFGSFTFDSALDGSVLGSYGDLSAFSFTAPALGGFSYNLAFANGSTTRSFLFDTATDSFVFGGSSPLTAMGLLLGFNVENVLIWENALGIPTNHAWDTVTTSRTTAAPVPEPGTLVLLGTALAGLASHLARTRMQRRRANA